MQDLTWNAAQGVQAAIVLLSGAAIWLVGRPEDWRRWGYIVGLAGQPLWLWVTWREGQFGLFLLSLWWLYAWGQGVACHWLAPWWQGRARRKAVSWCLAAMHCKPLPWWRRR